ncbi:hypothetical protein KBD81_03785 [Candidatus Woesebacteria bacterium]|nr:hypothetical protein [Candidatus Woesebacteria bacterium]
MLTKKIVKSWGKEKIKQVKFRYNWGDNMINYEFNFWDNLFAIIGTIINAGIAILIYKLSKQLSARDKYRHEVKITKEIEKIKIYSGVILSDVGKYHPLRTDLTNSDYYKQGAEIYTIIPEFGVQFILLPSDGNIPVGLVPFEWIEYVRDYDSDDNKPIVVCRFKGMKWFKRHRSPFREINYIYHNQNYKESSDPSFLKFTTVKPNHS